MAEDPGLGLGLDLSEDVADHEARLTRRRKQRQERKPKVQWNENMKSALAHIVYTEKQKGRLWMKRTEDRWGEFFPRYDTLTSKNLRDMYAKLPESIKELGSRDDFNLQFIIDKENEDYEWSNDVRLVHDTKGYGEENYQKTLREESQVSLALTEEESKLLERTRYWTNEVVTERKSFYFKIKPKTTDLEERNNQINNILTRKTEWSLWEINCLLYAVQESIAESMGIKNPHQSDNAKQHTRQYNSGQGVVDLRKWIAWVSNILDARRKNIKLSNKQKANLRKIKSKYNPSSSSKLREIREKLYQQLKVSCAREWKLTASRKAKEENRQFVKSQSNWLKNKQHVGRESDSKSMASMTDFENFWGEIWKKPENMNTEVWEQILTIMNKHIKVNSQEREHPNIKERDLKKVLKKIKPWGGTGWDQLAAFWWKKMPNIHTILLEIVINMFKEGKCPDWETLGRTILIGKKGKSMDKAENFRPITCLSVIYKIQSALVNIKLREHILENKIWPFEQLGTLEGTLGAKEAILFDRYIVRETRLYKINLSVAWTDVRKAYDSLYQEFIIKMLQFIRVPEWITAWLKMAMSSWRTILQVKKERIGFYQRK